MNNHINNLKWLYIKCRKFIPHIIVITIICSLKSLISVGTALCTKYIIDSSYTGSISTAKKWILFLGLMLLAAIVLSSLDTIFSTYSSEKIRNDLQKKIYFHIINSKWSEHNKYHSTDFLTRITNDVTSIVDMIIYTIPNIISLSVLLITSFGAIFLLSTELSIIAALLFPFLILLSKIYGHKLNKFYISIQKCESFFNKFVQESFKNILIVKSFCLEKNRLKDFSNIQNERFNLKMRRSYLSCISNGFFSLSSFSGYFIVLMWGIYEFNTSSSDIFGNLTALIQLFSNIQQPIYGLASAFPALIYAISAAQRLIELDNMELEHISRLLTCHNSFEHINSIPYTLELKAVNFGYDTDNKILKNISLTLHSGDIVGVIGESGQGKTTLIRLLLGLITPSSGHILINNEILTAKHRKLISYIPQGNTLFSASIIDNIKIAYPAADEAAINKCLRLSASENFINSLPFKINTILGEDGSGISEGQCQRLCIARGLLKQTPILILDEATSSLDNMTELNILKNITSLKHHPICIIITHRPAALSFCNKIYEIKNSKLIIK